MWFGYWSTSSQREYYHNVNTKQDTYEKPRGGISPPLSASSLIIAAVKFVYKKTQSLKRSRQSENELDSDRPQKKTKLEEAENVEVTQYTFIFFIIEKPPQYSGSSWMRLISLALTLFLLMIVTFALLH